MSSNPFNSTTYPQPPPYSSHSSYSKSEIYPCFDSCKDNENMFQCIEDCEKNNNNKKISASKWTQCPKGQSWVCPDSVNDCLCAYLD